MIDSIVFQNMIESPVRAFTGRVEIYEGSTLALMCGCHDSLKSFTIERVGADKFFGYGVCQKINVKLIDNDRNINVSTANNVEVVMGVGSDYIYPCPTFKVTEVNRDENTNELSITAYDALYEATNHTVAELELQALYTMKEFAMACAAFLGLPLNDVDGAFDLSYQTGANFNGTETIRQALDAIAEATQTIYFINWDWELTFIRLDKDGEAKLTIDKSKYFTMDSGTNRRLTKIVSVTELGDNVSAEMEISGTTQHIYNNPFLELREDIGTILDTAITTIGGLTINQFDCSWRGNFLLEIGDKIELITNDNNSVISYLLNDSLTFDGSLSQKTEWRFSEDEAVFSNSTSLGDTLNHTTAKVDKANNEISLLTNEVAANSEQIASLVLDTEGITATVQNIEAKSTEDLENINSELTTLSSSVAAKMSAEDVQIQIETELANGVDKVVTSTGFTFDENGLTVSKTGSEMTTTITEDGMQVFRDSEAVLTANNIGVNAVNLQATTYLIIGTNSRFENYGTNRTGCFWIGGNS